MGDPIAANSHASFDQADRLNALVKQLRTPKELLEGLCDPELNIAHLLTCEGAAATLQGSLRTLGNCTEAFARQLLEQVNATSNDDASTQVMVFTSEYQAPLSVLALPFSRSESGWLFWLRNQQADTDAVWSQADKRIAMYLRHELMEVALERALGMGAVLRRLISTLGHSLCNPLQSISMSAALLKPQDKRSIELREHISVASEKMEQQINQALDMNRLQGGEHLRLSPVRTNLSNLTASEVSRMRNSMPQLDLRASIDADINALLDPERLTQATRHLLGNAAQYATPGSTVNLTLTTEAQSGDICLTVDNQTARLSPAQLNALQSTSQYGTSGPSRGNRMGAGLYMTQGIARSHGGSLKVQQLGDRVAFQFSLPADARAAS
ncbi:MAG: ATP-binding protein [Pseudomonas sp.]